MPIYFRPPSAPSYVLTKDLWYGSFPVKRVFRRSETKYDMIWERGEYFDETFQYGSSGYLSERPNTLWRDGECTDASKSRAYLVSDGDVRGKSTTTDGIYDSRAWLKTPFKNYDVEAHIHLGSAPRTTEGVSLYVGNPNESSYEIYLEDGNLIVKRYKEGATTGNWATETVLSVAPAYYHFSIKRVYNGPDSDIIEVFQWMNEQSKTSRFRSTVLRPDTISLDDRHRSTSYNYVGIRTRFRRASFTNYGPPSIKRIVVDDR